MSRTHSEQLDQLATALAQAQGEFSAIPKDSSNPFFKSKYAGLPKVVEVASPILAKHSLSVSQWIGTDDAGETLTTWLLHGSGQFICDSMRLHTAPANKGLTDVQAQGSATTYARRYSYMSVLGLVADDDDDGNSAARPRQQQAHATNGNGTTTAVLPDTSVQEVVEAIKRCAKDSEWVRSQLVAVGAQDVPEGTLTLGTIRRLTPEQAVEMVKLCDAVAA